MLFLVVHPRTRLFQTTCLLLEQYQEKWLLLLPLANINLTLKLNGRKLLTNLFDRFYLNDSFKKVREWLDVRDLNTITPESFHETEKKIPNFEQKFSDYMNYFQFIISLKNMGQLKENEISSMFNYYLIKLRDTKFVMNYLKGFGYHALHSYLSQYKNVE